MTNQSQQENIARKTANNLRHILDSAFLCQPVAIENSTFERLLKEEGDKPSFDIFYGKHFPQGRTTMYEFTEFLCDMMQYPDEQFVGNTLFPILFPNIKELGEPPVYNSKMRPVKEQFGPEQSIVREGAVFRIHGTHFEI